MFSKDDDNNDSDGDGNVMLRALQNLFSNHAPQSAQNSN